MSMVRTFGKQVVRTLSLMGVGILVVAAPAKGGEGFLPVAPTLVNDQKSVYATVETVDVIQARARIGGTITRLVVDEGSAVREGQRIALVDDKKLQLQLRSLQARIDSTAAQRKLALTALERTKSLLKSGTVAQKRLDEAQANFDAADQAWTQAKAENDVIRQQQSEGAVLAPASGRVIKVNATEGAVVMPGESVAAIAAQGFVLRLALPERHARFLKVGDPVTVLGAENREGRVRQVYPEVKQGRIIADVDVPGLGGFFVGERIRVQIRTGARSTFVVPEDYVFNRYGVSFVRLRSGQDVVVQPGRKTETGVEIMSGLVAGDELVKP